MVTAATDLLPEMASDRLGEGLRVVFDQDLGSNSASPKSGSRSSSDCSDSVNGSLTRGTDRGRQRSPSSSTSSLSSSSRPRSRSHPRCHRKSSRCRCATHDRKAHGHRRRRSPPRGSRAHSRSCSPSTAPVKSSRHRSNRSRATSNSRQRRSKGVVGQEKSKSSSKSHRSRSRSSRRPVASPTLDENVNPTVDEPSEECPTPELQAWVRPEAVPEKAPSQDSDVEPDFQRSKVSPIRRIISFSIHNSVAKPTVAPVTSGKVTSRVDGVDGRKPYGHWVPVGRGAPARKRTSR
ncbi:hypothetical protein NHX12_019439 [Muraenolepis orangiensis]|uniref:Arginine/serine-rich protein 1 n=1 Tax=Muraenolepis orangiensis TaxID=630683 RepID=A0A9Q0EYQ2_9TELE|nr:hypothetical protein NHX12_019439 [Muraenolepis orangiensis]